jgi:hypothetical protein
VPIIRRNSCVYATLGTCYSVWLTVWYAGSNEDGRPSFIPPCVPDSQPHRITSTKCRINTVSCFSWWWAHSRPKHVKIYKYIKNKLCTIWLYLQKDLSPYIIASITECQTGQLLSFLTTNKTDGITSAWNTGTNRFSAISDERNTMTMTKRDPLWISYILRELPCSEKNSWPN